jgi:hypothetical protein
MKLLISPQNMEEAWAAVEGGADIIDVKNPAEGSLGANFPWVIKEIIDMVPEGVETSATLGDLPQKPGTAALAARGLATLGVDYIKGGLYGSKDESEALEMAGALMKAIKGSGSRLVLAGYADYRDKGLLSPFILPKIAREVGAFGVMIDTAEKNGSGLLDYLSVEELKDFVHKAHDLGLEAALAGSLKEEDIKDLKEIGVDIVGVRGVVCEKGDRRKGTIKEGKVKRLSNMLKNNNM